MPISRITSTARKPAPRITTPAIAGIRIMAFMRFLLSIEREGITAALISVM
jgi:hypothetical protein